MDASKKEPMPCGNGDSVLDSVLDDFKKRSLVGTEKYGTELKTFNGRNSLNDAYQEACDLVMYLRQHMLETHTAMPLNDYQSLAQETAVYPGKGENLNYPIHGLNGEAGEVADKFKKIIRDKGGIMSSDDSESIAKELGDVLWYVSEIAFELGYTLQTIATMNIKKLSSRKKRGMIGGSGDNR